jgi:hypothetical protein
MARKSANNTFLSKKEGILSFPGDAPITMSYRKYDTLSIFGYYRKKTSNCPELTGF